MKKINILITIIAIALTVGSCETYDDYDQDRKTVAGFVQNSRNINNVPTGSYKDITVDIFVSDVSNSDRQFNIVAIPAILDPSAVPPQVETNPDNYTFDSTVTIPANTREGSITISGTNSSISNDEEYFSLAVEGTENVVSGQTITVRLRI